MDFVGAFSLAILMVYLSNQAQDATAVLSLINDDFLKWAFRGLIAAGAAYLFRDHSHQRRQDEAIMRLEHAMSLNHPSRADFEAYQLRQEQKLEQVRENLQSVDRLVRLMAAKMNIDVRD